VVVDLDTWTHCAQILRDSVVIFGATATAIAAWRGLHAWREQLVGKERHRVAGDLLKGAIVWRDGIRRARSPFMYQSEMRAFDEAEAKTLDAQPESGDPESRAYYRRWESIREGRARLETAAVEAEVYVGDWVKTWLSDALTIELKLRHAIEGHLRDRDSHHTLSDTKMDAWREREDVLYDSGADDSFWKQVDDHVDDLKRRLRAVLRPAMREDRRVYLGRLTRL
jgi:hypothetical protein